MKQRTLTITKGLPGSGKSTWAKQKVIDDNGATIRINKDDLRAMLHNDVFSKPNEDMVIETQMSLLNTALQNHRNIIIDDTNFNPVHERRFRDHVNVWNNLRNARDPSYSVVIKDFTDVDVNECIKRDSKREKSVGAKVIYDMSNKWMRSGTKFEATPKRDSNLPDAIIVDVDGTLALHQGRRSPYDWSRVKDDTCDATVSLIVEMISRQNVDVIVLSGRDSVCRTDTQNWLHYYSIPHTALFMRAEGDQRKDTIIKQELYEQHIKDKYNVLFALDDRDGVVDMWRSLGIKCLQCEPGCF